MNQPLNEELFQQLQTLAEKSAGGFHFYYGAAAAGAPTAPGNGNGSEEPEPPVQQNSEVISALDKNRLPTYLPDRVGDIHGDGALKLNGKGFMVMLQRPPEERYLETEKFWVRPEKIRADSETAFREFYQVVYSPARPGLVGYYVAAATVRHTGGAPLPGEGLIARTVLAVARRYL